MTNNSSLDLLTTKEVAAILKMHVGTLKNWRALKTHPLRFMRIGRDVRYSAEDLRDFINGKLPPKEKLTKPKQTIITQMWIDGEWYDELWENGKFVSRGKHKTV
jgi:excisionase family DNA binding protein